MFVYRREDLPPEHEFPADLEKLGYFINENDQIRKIADPKEDFQYKINKNARVNEMQREAMSECIRKIVASRLRELNLTTLRLPLTSKVNEAHVPILVSSNLSTASRIIVVFGEPVQDLGIWAYRSIGVDGINAGSAVSFAKAVLRPEPNEEGTDTESFSKRGDTALMLANTGQLIWHCGARRPMTLPSWLAYPRPSAVDPPLMMTHRNKIPSNSCWEDHVACVFDEILADRGRLVRHDARINIVGIAEGGQGAIRYLSLNWEHWRGYISAIVFTNPLHSVDLELAVTDEISGSFLAFISSRCRAYVISDELQGCLVPGARRHGCNCYSSGERQHVECIMPRAWKHMLEWLNRAHADPTMYEAQLKLKEMDGSESETVGLNGSNE
ncbi:Arb2 domain-containing protein [Aspergillus pseudonomiae]|uniref:Arb2 domain-containing protein n=1 Tax=Aspergillus pseudonomiae TaxID=1506151 RepID=A0A5N6I382_9EURO|nr:Arb2 domain-containing protein [Aspergillus pseudonomiae]KAB8261175.1 Arb2 domain-containing protein [Aspergillus pseudonomiae]KAE8403683.1 Arb2 domain-containing protein [Aspergillus pseudonomiae]